MRYWLHPEAEDDLRDAAEFYRERADDRLSRSLLFEFRRPSNLLLRHPVSAHSGGTAGVVW